MRRGPVTLVSAIYSTDGQLHQNVISGPKPALLSLPEEGLYILHWNRGLQVASACDQRKCYMAQLCRCTEEQHNVHEHISIVATNSGTKEQTANQLAKRFIRNRALARLNFYEIADEIRSLRLCFLAHPRTLSWDNVFENFAFHFDSELEQHYASTSNYKRAPLSINRSVKENPQGLLGFVRDAWQEFLGRGDHDSRQTTAFPERGDDEVTEDGEDLAYDGDVDDDLSEWDDAGSPIHPDYTFPSTAPRTNYKKRPRQEDDFDFIDDLIDEEFPRLKKTMLEPQATESTKRARHASIGRPEKIRKTRNTTESGITNGITKTNKRNSRRISMTAANIHENLPAPVIIPPKNMLLARGLADCSFGEQQGFRNCELSLLREADREALQETTHIAQEAGKGQQAGAEGGGTDRYA
ncbi:hypothetical protein FHL15_006597 [Xylaria flabelliformis]|uniref:Uncharacterized protein n=1 Tax=Xylaria flabelliformis TaxID=2512241 RepID=A0A553HWU5_9PEZI|nr:hypothetical protein FHL15_006597 [Xylaria flabelliformis]